MAIAVSTDPVSAAGVSMADGRLSLLLMTLLNTLLDLEGSNRIWIFEFEFWVWV